MGPLSPSKIRRGGYFCYECVAARLPRWHSRQKGPAVWPKLPHDVLAGSTEVNSSTGTGGRNSNCSPYRSYYHTYLFLVTSTLQLAVTNLSCLSPSLGRHHGLTRGVAYKTPASLLKQPCSSLISPLAPDSPPTFQTDSRKAATLLLSESSAALRWPTRHLANFRPLLALTFRKRNSTFRSATTTSSVP